MRCFAAIVLAAPASAAQFPFDDYKQVEPPARLREPVAGWQKAMAGEDAGAVAGKYAADGWLKLPCAPAAMSRSKIGEQWRNYWSSSPATVSLQPSSFDLATGKDMAVERGWAQLTQNVGGMPYATNVDYVRVWRKAGRSWLIAVDLFAAGGLCAELGQ